MDQRITRIRRKLALIPHQACRSHSFGEESHRFRRGPKLTGRQIAELERRLAVEFPEGYRDFLRHVEGHGAAPFYGIMPPGYWRLFTMNPRGDRLTRGFTQADILDRRGDLFLDIIEAGCSDLVLIGVTGPLTGRIITGNADGSWGPDLFPAPDFLAWYERWLDTITTGGDDRRLHLTSPGIAQHGRNAAATQRLREFGASGLGGGPGRGARGPV